MKWMNLLAAVVVVSISSTAHAELRNRFSRPIEADENENRPALLVPAAEQDEYFTTSENAADELAINQFHGDLPTDYADCGCGCLPSRFSGLWEGFCGSGHCRSCRPSWFSGLHLNGCHGGMSCGQVWPCCPTLPALPCCPAVPKLCLPKIDFPSLRGLGCHSCATDCCEGDCCGKKSIFDGLFGHFQLHGRHCFGPAACDCNDDCGCADHSNWLNSGSIEKVEQPLQPIPQTDEAVTPAEESSVMRSLLPSRFNLLPIGLSL